MSNEILISVDRPELRSGLVLIEDAGSLINGFHDAIAKMVHFHLGNPSRQRTTDEARLLSRTALCAVREGSGVLAFEPVDTETSDYRHPAIICASDIVDGIQFYQHNGSWPTYLPPVVRNRIGACLAPVLGDNITVSLSVKEGLHIKTSSMNTDTQRALQQQEDFAANEAIEVVGKIYDINEAARTVKVNTYPKRLTIDVDDFFSDVDTNMRWKKVFARGYPADPKCKQLTNIEFIRLADEGQPPGVVLPSEHKRAEQFEVFKVAHSRVSEFVKYAPNWNSYSAQPVAEKNAQCALRFLADALLVLDDHDIILPGPFVVPTPSGGVQFEWEHERRSLELEIDEDGRFNYLIFDAGHEKEGIATRWLALRLVRWLATGEEA